MGCFGKSIVFFLPCLNVSLFKNFSIVLNFNFISTIVLGLQIPAFYLIYWHTYYTVFLNNGFAVFQYYFELPNKIRISGKRIFHPVVFDKLNSFLITIRKIDTQTSKYFTLFLVAKLGTFILILLFRYWKQRLPILQRLHYI